MQAEVQAVMMLGSYDPIDPMELEVSVVSKDARGSLWNAPRGEAQCRPLELWSKARPLFAANYMF